MNSKQRSEQIFGGSFLIGLAILFITGYWWPGIMFVIGLSMLIRTVTEGKPWSSDHNALIVLAIGVFFGLPIFGGNWLPLLLIALGAYMLFGDRLGLRPETKRRDDFDFPKRGDDKPKNDVL
ncbi:MAG: hypothetical protein J0M07_16000 [Anaerolineae bacterium]|uniref:hypothetical protein n=1 Tax=Candidatus Flexifilum breve TaxID=3140694 RepID=UPI001ACAFC76|nr:hypothetical protein [Chloroflexota bacterium]MBK9749237.1 hypothetical protein [Chloroflexota bacterium]MBN8636831.1 hypothetical protein [Anaerolineae bacterium]